MHIIDNSFNYLNFFLQGTENLFDMYYIPTTSYTIQQTQLVNISSTSFTLNYYKSYTYLYIIITYMTVYASILDFPFTSMYSV